MIRNDIIYPSMLIIGHARHGKDTVAEHLRDKYGFRFISSSMFCADRIVRPAVEEWFTGTESIHSDIVARHWGRAKTSLSKAPPWRGVYTSAAECFEDRVNHRSMWFDLISAYNKQDAACLGRDILADSDIYVGCRASRELHALVNEGVADLVIWVDRSEVEPLEQKSSMQLGPWMADYVIDNNGSIEDLYQEVDRLVKSRLHSVAENHR